MTSENEKTRTRVADAVSEHMSSMGRRSRIWTGGDVIRIYVRAANNADLGYVSIDDDGDIIVDGWTGASQTKSQMAKYTTRTVSDLEYVATACGVSVYPGANS